MARGTAAVRTGSRWGTLEATLLLLALLALGFLLVPAHWGSIWMDREFTGGIGPLANRLGDGTRLYADGTHIPLPPLSFVVMRLVSGGTQAGLLGASSTTSSRRHRGAGRRWGPRPRRGDGRELAARGARVTACFTRDEAAEVPLATHEAGDPDPRRSTRPTSRGRATARFYVAAAAAALAVLFLSDGEKWALYLPCFALGTIMAFQHDRIVALRATRARAFEPALVTASVLGLTASSWLLIRDQDPRIASKLGPVLVALGACRMVTLAVAGPRACRFLDTRPVAWSGTRSFSLYLVQEPIVVLTAFALGATWALPLLIVVATPPVLLLTEGFYRVVERPSHRLARRVRLPASVRERS